MDGADTLESHETLTGGRSLRKILLITVGGSSIEWYDFIVYGVAAALIFPEVFFPEFSPVSGALLAFSSFGVGLLARPVGGLIFGYFGDKAGRKKALVGALLMMGIATTLIGLLPTYATIGVLAPVLLVVLRLCQGLAVGGQWGGAVLIATENAPRNRRGLYGSFAQLGNPAGIVLSTLVFLVVSASMSQEAFVAWGWRIPFLLSVALVILAIYAALRLEDTVAFERVKETHTEARMPMVDVFRVYPKEIALAAGAYLAIPLNVYILATYIISYGTEALGLAREVMLMGVTVAAVFMVFAILFAASLSDRVGRKPLYVVGTVLLGLWAFPLFWLINTQSVALIWFALVVGNVLIGVMFGPMGALFSELFGTRVRYSGMSMSFQIGAILGGAFAPVIATALLAATNTSMAISAYMAIGALVSLVSIILISETYQRDIEELRPEERRAIAQQPE